MLNLDSFGLSTSEVSDRMVFIVNLERKAIDFASGLAYSKLGYGKNELMELRISDLLPSEMTEMDEFIGLVKMTEELTADSLHCVTRNGQVLSSTISGIIKPYLGTDYLVAKIDLED